MTLTPAQLEHYFLAVERRAQSEPIQYITGVQEFYGLPLQVTPAVLIPRPETEHLVEAAIAIARQSSGPLRILDVGTGSGAIAIALAYVLPDAAIVATDISPAALLIAQRNAKQHGVADRITFLECNLVPQDAMPFDIICSNPPYIANSELLEPQVAAFEPHLALFAGPTGLECYQRLIPLAAQSCILAERYCWKSDTVRVLQSNLYLLHRIGRRHNLLTIYKAFHAWPWPISRAQL